MTRNLILLLAIAILCLTAAWAFVVGPLEEAPERATERGPARAEPIRPLGIPPAPRPTKAPLPQGILGTPGDLSGRLVAPDGTPLGEIEVGATLLDGRFESTRSRRNGTFTLHLPPCARPEWWVQMPGLPGHRYLEIEKEDLLPRTKGSGDLHEIVLPAPLLTRVVDIVDEKDHPITDLQMVARPRDSGAIDTLIHAQPGDRPGRFRFPGVWNTIWILQAMSPRGKIWTQELRWGQSEQAPIQRLVWKRDPGGGQIPPRRVIDARTGRPIPRAKLVLELTTSPRGRRAISTAPRPKRAHLRLELITDARGRFDLREDRPWIPGRLLPGPGFFLSDPARKVKARAGDLVVVPGVRIGGQVQDESGSPLVRFRVNGHLVEDAGGRFELILDPAERDLRIEAAERVPFNKLRPEAIGPGGRWKVQPDPITLVRRVSRPVLVRDARGRPVEGALIYGRSHTGSTMKRLAVTEPGGHADVFLSSGRTLLQAIHPEVGLSAAMTVFMKDEAVVELLLRPSRRVEGRADRPGRDVRLDTGLERCLIAGEAGRFDFFAPTTVTLSGEAPSERGLLRTIVIDAPRGTEAITAAELWSATPGKIRLRWEEQRVHQIMIRSVKKTTRGGAVRSLGPVTSDTPEPPFVALISGIVPGHYEVRYTDDRVTPRMQRVQRGIEVRAGELTEVEILKVDTLPKPRPETNYHLRAAHHDRRRMFEITP